MVLLVGQARRYLHYEDDRVWIEFRTGLPELREALDTTGSFTGHSLTNTNQSAPRIGGSVDDVCNEGILAICTIVYLRITLQFVSIFMREKMRLD